MTLPFVERIFVVNLAERTDRRRDIRRQFERAGWDPDDPSICYFDAIRPPDAGSFPSVGARGCFMSQLGVIRQAAEEGLSSIAVFEDDLDFAEDFTVRLKAAADALNRADWSIFYGGHETNTPIDAKGPATAIGPEVDLWTAHFFCVRGEAIPALRDYLTAMLARPAGDPDGGPMHVDGAYQWFRKAHPEMACLVATPPLGFQRASKSDIAALKWFDRTPAVKTAVAAMRRLRRRLT